MASSPVPRALTLAEVARWLGISMTTLQSRIADGVLRTTKVDGVETVQGKDLQAWIEASRVKPGSLPWARQVWDPETGRWRCRLP